MKTLAIKGHKTKGKEVIEILEMLGGKNPYNYIACCESMYFYISQQTNIIYYDWCVGLGSKDMVMFTLEEFWKKYPYKVGDTVIYKGKPMEITKMVWEASSVCYKLDDRLYCNVVNEFQPYKEEIVDTGCCSMPTKTPMYKLNIKEQKDTNKVIFETNSQCCDISNKTIKKETMEKEISGAIVDRFICLEGYDFYDDKGNIIDTKEITMKKKQPKYPKTYEECYKVLQMPKDESYIDIDVPLSYNKVLTLFTQLLICRDAYWKIAGEQMGLGKSWKPNWSIYEHKFCLGTDKDKIIEECVTTGNRIIAFPTKEMRDAFYENFKKLIEECKELL